MNVKVSARACVVILIVSLHSKLIFAVRHYRARDGYRNEIVISLQSVAKTISRIHVIAGLYAVIVTQPLVY